MIFGSTQLGGANDAPLAAADIIDVGTFDRVDLAADNGAGTDRDPDFDDLSIVAIDGTAVAPGGSVTLASGLRVTLVGGTEVRFDAPGVALGTSLSDSFVYEISDGRGGSASATVTVDFTQDAIALADLDGSNGFRLDGIDAYDRSGSSVAGAGDVNGDGFDDLIVGAAAGPTARTTPARATSSSARTPASRRASTSRRSTGRTASASTGSTRTTAAALGRGRGRRQRRRLRRPDRRGASRRPGRQVRRRRELRRLRHGRRLRGEPRSLGARRHRTASASTGSTRTTTAASRSPARATSTATASTT